MASAGEKFALGATTVVGGSALLASYALAIGNVGKYFPSVKRELESTNYFDSPFWLDIPTSTTKALCGLQGMAAVGFIVLIVWRLVATEEASQGPLRRMPAFTAIIATLLLASLAWPYLARWTLHKPSPQNIALCVASLIVAALAVILVIADAFESDVTPWYALLGAVLLGVVVVLADGVGWSARLIQQYNQGKL